MNDLSTGESGVVEAGVGEASAAQAGVGEAGVGAACAAQAGGGEAGAALAGAVEATAGGRRISVFLVDDHEIIRRGLRDLLEAEPDMEVIGEAGTAASGVHRILALRPDVAVLDVRLPDGDGVSVCREIRSTLPETACLMLTSYGDDQALLGAIMAGAAGYVLKETCGSDLVGAVRTVAGGGSMLDAHATQRVMERLRERMAGVDPLSALTDQEKRVLELIGEGLTNRQISERMVLSEKTAKNYVSSVLTKLGMQRRAQAAAFAARLADSHSD
jgi:DNA-binding NarL/FixJ family response regulator